ncbi:MAG TPA: site-specific integrase [Cyclobacteriaceae bacterium]
MEKRVTYSTSFLLRSSKGDKNESLIYCRITVDMQRTEFSIKRKIRKELWNNGQAKNNSEEGKTINAYIKQVEAQIFQHYRDMLAERKLVTAEALKNAYHGVLDNEQSLLSLVEYHNTQLEHTLEWGTLKNYFTTQKYIKLFLTKRVHTSDILLSQLKYKFIIDFEFFLRQYVPEDYHKPMGNNTVMKHIERFRKMINVAVRMEWLERDPFSAFQQKFEKVEREYLSQEELTKIEFLDFRISRLQWVRDLFVFSCYTGLAYIDVMRLTPENITKGIDGELWLMTSRQKTNNPVHVPLLPKALEIIDRYKGHQRALVEGTLFPNISNQKLNSYLKEIADLCDIKKNLTFHLARHTFATVITLTNGVPIESVSKMLGHSTIRTTQIYAKVIEKKLSDDMKELKAKLNSDSANKNMLSLQTN